MTKNHILILLLVFVGSFQAKAGYSFVEIMKGLTTDKKNVVAEIPQAEGFQKVKTLAAAMQISQSQSYPQMLTLETAGQAALDKEISRSLIEKKTLTFVIVPGLLGEFISTRAFEEVFARPSSYKAQWAKSMEQSPIKDQRFSLKDLASKQVPLAELINAASIDDANGKPLLKLIILKTDIGSMESIGDNVAKAAVFNRRVQAYFDLTHDEDIVLLGYSRGTPLALEMVTQAESQKLSYLNHVRALVSYAGVVTGSSLADVTDDLNTESGRLFAAAKKLQSKLENSPNGFYALRNGAAVGEFLLALGMNSELDLDAALKNSMSGDFRTVAMLIAKLSFQLGITSITDFNGRVNRFRTVVSEILTSVEGLKTKNAITWWKTHTLPKHIKYMSLSAAMVDPIKSEIEKAIFNSKEGYNETLDDDSLQGNRRTYEKVTGFALNDSQVALHQSLFLPGLIGSLNPANADLHFESLGLLQTHHWGVSLRVVNVMKDGRVNPYPREKVLLSLAAYLNQ